MPVTTTKVKQFSRSAGSCRYSDIFQNVLNDGKKNLGAVNAYREAVRGHSDDS